MTSAEPGWFPTPVDTAWIDSVGAPVHPVLLEMEALARRGGVPIVDRASGRVLMSLAVGRTCIVEIGTAIGYSTLWLALGQGRAGRIVTIDPAIASTDRARRFWRAAGFEDERIEVVSATALHAFAAGDPRLDGPFDLAFIDALKPEYSAYLEALAPRLAPGALVLADNVLWSGRVSGSRPDSPGDGNATALRRFCETVLADQRFVGTILPIGDGLLVATLRGGDG